MNPDPRPRPPALAPLLGRAAAAPAAASTRPRAGMRPQRAVALVITLILLSVITVVTVTILAIARRDRAVLTQTTNLTDARLAADAALERATAEVVAQIQAATNLLGFDFTVSRSYPANLAPWLANPVLLTNLFVDPRVPVFPPPTSRLPSETLEGRFFLDLNRNDQFEETVAGLMGDPQWIGILEKSDRPHGPNNRFIARYCFVIVPTGKALDLNWIHNISSGGSGSGYQRNQGFGPWEINLAAFLTDLAPGYWTYDYRPPVSLGSSFADARDMLLFRFRTNDFRRPILTPLNSLLQVPTVFHLFGPTGAVAFRSDWIDGYCDDPGPMGLAYPTTDNDNPRLPWPGADSLQHYFTHQDLWDPFKSSTNFTARLAQAGASTNFDRFGFKDRYAFYRLIAQAATGSEAETEDKIHLNYLTDTNPAAPVFATNFVSWTNAPEVFLVRVADRLLQEQFAEFNPNLPAYTNVASVTNIPVNPTNEYSPALHRLLQLAANIYDATRTNRFPSVFRPLFASNAFGVSIVGWTNDPDRRTLPNWLAANRQYGIPFVIGAKKGFPNFNEYTLETDFQVTRKLEFVRPDTNSPPDATNQMYILTISNLFAAEAWNSYSTPYPGTLQIEAANAATVRITNQAGLNYVRVFNYGVTTNLVNWPGGQFVTPLFLQTNIVDPAAYRFTTRTFDPVGINFYEEGIGFPLPDWTFTLSNQFLYVLSDGDQIVDFVLSTDFRSDIYLDEVLMEARRIRGLGGENEPGIIAELWNTNRIDGSVNDQVPTVGIALQTDVALGNRQVSDTVWRSYLDENYRGLDKPKAIASIRAFFQMGGTTYSTNLIGMTSNRLQAPFCPTRKMIKTVTWQANDPLVHYHIGDLLLYPTNSIIEAIVPPTMPVPTNMTLASIGRLNDRYAPWGGNPEKNDPLSPTDPYAYNPAIKDPGVRTSDDWDFPNAPFPNIGWLGRVHRGTPWQTIYLKPDVAPREAWRNQTADYLWGPWFRTHPTNDWWIVDLFTTAPDRNATRGRLSVNQTNLAAWSALLAGVNLLRNPLTDEPLLSIGTNAAIPVQEELILPAATDTNVPPLVQKFVDGLNTFRLTLPNGAFESIAEFLQAPVLTTQSPWLNLSPIQQQFGLTDTMIERLPQMILSLVKVGEPRVTIYAYGQALKPARDSILQSGPATGLCTNYQVTAEVVTRAVLRIEGAPQAPRAVIETFNILPPD